jgi:CheY-like chemotaxis protein
LLAFGRKQDLRAQPLNLNDVIANLVKMLTRVIGEDIRLQCNYTERLPPVQADPGMIEQLLMNLVVNARDAMRSGGRLTIATRETVADRKAPTGNCVCLSVSDTGCGIAPEHLPRIFEPFFTTKEVGKGTGLGLATVHGIVQQHGGWIDVESELGKGTTFHIYLPASPASPGQQETAAPEKAMRGGTETILIVEDEAAVRELAARFLAGLGYKILQAESGVAALEAWRQQKGAIDLLFTDLVMPDRLNGWQLAEVLMAERPGLKVLFCSGYGMEVAGKEFVLQLGKNFLPKPYTPHKLAAAVRDCLDASPATS